MTQTAKAHPISIERSSNRVRVHCNGRVVADSRSALTLREASLRPVQYIPREDVDMTMLERTSHRTHCPFKGDASYYTLSLDGRWRKTRPGPTRIPILGLRPSRTTSPSIPSGSTRSRNCQADDFAARRGYKMAAPEPK
jgi:hypothetical protein